METTVPIVIAIVSLALLGLGAIVDDRRTRARRLAVGTIELPLLHSINDDRCIGCEACVDVCPTEVLELVDHKARPVRFSDCVQCEQCANACPTTALVMYRQGSSPQTLTVPELDDRFMTGVPGQYLIGEVAGKPLVKNAANLGRAVIEHIARDLAGQPAAASGVLDVAIVGSGPGGLSAGLTCMVKRLSCVVIEKEHVMASTVARYPKGKLFMAEPVASGNLSYLPVFDATKEELVAAWKVVADGAKLPVKLGEAVETVKRGDDGIFTIKTTVSTYRARTVVLATGLRGKPRLLAVPGANLEKVQSRLEDPDGFGGKHVLVVGGGDSAVEAAMSLLDAGATVTLSYRGDGFKRCKQGNQKRLAELTAGGKLPVLLESNVTEFTANEVSIKLKSGEITTIQNQHAFVLIGADTPVAWLEANNVRFVEREHLYALGSTQDTVLRVAPDAVECARNPQEALAVVLGKAPHRHARPATRNERSVVTRIRDELHRTVNELTGVFKIVDLERAEPRSHRAASVGGRARTGRTPHPRLIPAANLVRTPPPTKLFAHHDAERPFTPVSTTVEIKSLPAMLREQQQKRDARTTSARATNTRTTSARPAAFPPDATVPSAPAWEHDERTVADAQPLGRATHGPGRNPPPPPPPRMKASAGAGAPMNPGRRAMMDVGTFPVIDDRPQPPPVPAPAKPAGPPPPPPRLALGTEPPPSPRAAVAPHVPSPAQPRAPRTPVRPPDRIMRKRTPE